MLDAVRDTAWITVVDATGIDKRKLAPEDLYGRRKMTALIRRTTIPPASRGSIDRAMRSLGLSGIRRDKSIRTTISAKDGIRAGDLLNRDFTAPRPDHTLVWTLRFAARGRGGFTSRSSSTCSRTASSAHTRRPANMSSW